MKIFLAISCIPTKSVSYNKKKKVNMGRLRVKIKLQLFPDNIERLLLRAVCYAGIYDLQR